MCVAYVALSLACVVAYQLAGMTLFDAIAHAMATLATGGFSTRDASFTNYSGRRCNGSSVVFMIAGALPFVLYLRAVRGDWSILRDRQSGVMLLILGSAPPCSRSGCTGMAAVRSRDAIRLAAFNATSVLTTTGFASDDFAVWGPLRGRDLLLSDVRRRLHRLDRRRDQDLPLPGAADRAARPHPAPLHAARDRAAHLRRQAARRSTWSRA